MNSSTNTQRKHELYLNLYFQVHQPRRLKKFQFFDIGSNVSCFDDALNKSILCRIATACYGPANRVLLKLIRKFPHIRITFSISGVALNQLQRYAPHVLDTFRELADTGAVEFLGETYYHSLAYFADKEEFITQVEQHRQQMISLLGKYPVIFRNTELIYADAIGKTVADLGFKGMYLDGIQKVLAGRPVNALYRHPDEDLVLFPRNYRLSDDIAFRYSDRNWSEWPLTTGKYASWLEHTPDNEKIVNLGMDYETFGEHQKAGDGILEFLETLITKLAREKRFRFVTPSEAVDLLPAHPIISTEKAISWADEARDLSPWLGNDMQRDAFASLNKLHGMIMENGNDELVNTYRHLQTSDHFYYMSTKRDNDGNVHQYFSPYASPYEAFMNYMNVVADLEVRIRQKIKKRILSSQIFSRGRAFSEL